MKQTTATAIHEGFNLSASTWLQAKAQADALGLSVSEYMGLLVDEDKTLLVVKRKY